MVRVAARARSWECARILDDGFNLTGDGAGDSRLDDEMRSISFEFGEEDERLERRRHTTLHVLASHICDE
jgi:hypothetical protein